jgi:hypothetical protein
MVLTSTRRQPEGMMGARFVTSRPAFSMASRCSVSNLRAISVEMGKGRSPSSRPALISG